MAMLQQTSGAASDGQQMVAQHMLMNEWQQQRGTRSNEPNFTDQELSTLMTTTQGMPSGNRDTGPPHLQKITTSASVPPQPTNKAMFKQANTDNDRPKRPLPTPLQDSEAPTTSSWGDLRANTVPEKTTSQKDLIFSMRNYSAPETRRVGRPKGNEKCIIPARIRHNGVERKYRENLNTHIEALRDAITSDASPNSNSAGADDASSADAERMSKAAVVAAVTEQIKIETEENMRLAQETHALEMALYETRGLVQYHGNNHGLAAH